MGLVNRKTESSSSSTHKRNHDIEMDSGTSKTYLGILEFEFIIILTHFLGGGPVIRRYVGRGKWGFGS